MSTSLAQGTRLGTTAIGVMFGLAAALIWSGWTIATRLAVTTSLSPNDVTFLRFGVSALFLWPILTRNGLGVSKLGWIPLLIMLVGAGLPFMLVASIGAKFAPASHIATLMNGVMPIFVAVLSWAFAGARFGRSQLGGLALVVLGVCCIGAYSVFVNRASGEWRGDLLFLLGGFLFASYTVVQRKSGISPWHATALVNVLSALVFAPIYFLWLEPNVMTANVNDVMFQAVAQGIGVAILGMFCYAEAVRRLGAPRAAIFGSMAPALAVLIGIPVLNEVPSVLTLAGVGLVMVGVAVVVTGGAGMAPTPAK